MKNTLLVIRFGSEKVQIKMDLKGLSDEAADRRINEAVERESRKRKTLPDFFEVE